MIKLELCPHHSPGLQTGFQCFAVVPSSCLALSRCFFKSCLLKIFPVSIFMTSLLSVLQINYLRHRGDARLVYSWLRTQAGARNKNFYFETQFLQLCWTFFSEKGCGIKTQGCVLFMKKSASPANLQQSKTQNHDQGPLLGHLYLNAFLKNGAILGLCL